MKKVNSLSDLLMEELADLLNMESQVGEALPKMADASQTASLKTALEECLTITKEHVSRIQDIFSNIGQNPQRLVCKAMEDLLTEGDDVINKTEKGPASDAAMLNVAQRVQKYEIARYKIVREHAADLNHSKIVEVFTKILNDERAMNFQFNELAQGMINTQAMEPSKTGGFYIPEGRLGMGTKRKKNKNPDESRYISEGNPNIEETQ
jgi:ferritin-like metal-binding protein YciE